MKRVENQVGSPARPGHYLALLAAVFLCGALAVIGLVGWVGTSTGATLLPETLAARQRDNRDLVVLPAELRHWAALKVPRIAATRPDVVIVGSSRGNEARSAMFRPYRLYNASLTCWSLEQTLAMIDHISRVDPPPVVIVSLDYFMFSNTYAKAVKNERSMYFDGDALIEYQSSINLLRSLHKYPSLWTSKFPPYLLGHPPQRSDGMTFLGLDAIRAEAGFRWDGSFLYEGGTLLNAPNQVAANLGLINAMPGNPRIEPQQWAILEAIARLAGERHFKLVGVQWPILRTSLDYLDNSPEYRPYSGIWREFQSPETAAKFQALGVAFFDVSGVPANDDSRNFIDAAHANEAGIANAMLALGADPRFRALFPDIDSASLEKARQSAVEDNNFTALFKADF